MLARAVAFALALTLLGGATAFAGPRERADRKLEASLDRIVAMRGGPPGVAVLVQRGRRARLHRAGVAVIRRGRPRRIRRTDRMRLASVAKAFSGAVSLQLVSRGALSLDEPIGRRLGSAIPQIWDGITLRQLLQHTSGIPNYTDSEEFARRLTSDPRGFMSTQDVVGFVNDDPLEFTPGSRYRYSNTDNIVVGMLVEAVTGDSYASELHDRIFRPLGLRRTSYPVGFRLTRPFVHGYAVDPPAPEDVSTAFSASGAGASGAIVSTPAELNRFIRAYVRGRFFRRTVRRRQLSFRRGSSQPTGPGSNAAGLGIFRYRTRCGTMYGHTGNFPGYTQFAGARRDGKRSATVSANTALSSPIDAPPVKALRRVMGRALCAALAPRR